MRAESSIELVFTVALRKELPCGWLEEQGVRVHTFKALRAGGLRPATGPNGGVLVVITGVGLEAAGEAADWIRANINPLFVVNIGTAGALKSDLSPGSWFTPQRLKSEQGETLAVDTRLPFPWPEGLERTVGGNLISVAEARPESPPADWAGADCVDMEAHAQARVLAGSGIAFHLLKWISDRPGRDAQVQFMRQMEHFRKALPEVLGFLRGPGSPDISVIIPVHNRAGEIRACVDSVLEQRLPAIEVIVVDDGSCDGTAEAVPVDSVRLIQLGQNLGVSVARNLGVAEARGNWIAFLDSDDRWQPDKLERQWEYLTHNPHYRAVQCGEIWIRNGRRVNPCDHHEKPQGWIWSRSLERCLVTPSAILMQRDLFERLNGFDESLPACEDYDLWLRLGRSHPVGLERTDGAIKYGGHADQLSRRYPAMDRFRVRALRKALEGEREVARRAALADMLRRKLAILIQGARKRGLGEELKGYEAKLAALSAVGEPHGHLGKSGTGVE